MAAPKSPHAPQCRQTGEQDAATVVRYLVRPALCLAAVAVLSGIACIPPVAFHDGLPAWAPEARQVEWRVGYQRLSVFGSDSFNFLGNPYSTSDFTVGYLTPGVRLGLKRPPMMADVGLVSAVTAGPGRLSALFGAALGLGYTTPNLNVMFRPSVYLIDVFSDHAEGTGADFGYWSQMTMLVGTGYRAPGWNFAAGGRAGPFGAGPVALVGVNLRPVDLRAELSWMFPVTDYASGRALSIGLTAAAPTRPEPDYGPAYGRREPERGLGMSGRMTRTAP